MSLDKIPGICILIGLFTKNSLTQYLSIIFLLNDSRVSNGGFVSASVRPKDRTNFLTASGENPLLFIPISVGSRGSSQLFMIFSSNNVFILRLEIGILSNSSLENSSIVGFLSFSLSSIEKYNVFLSSYSFVRIACVTPSTLSSIGVAKSYVGHTRNLLPNFG